MYHILYFLAVTQGHPMQKKKKQEQSEKTRSSIVAHFLTASNPNDFRILSTRFDLPTALTRLQGVVCMCAVYDGWVVASYPQNDYNIK